MSKLYEEHRYLLEGDLLSEGEKSVFISILNKKSNESEIGSAISQLSEFVARKFDKNTIILMDEYDSASSRSRIELAGESHAAEGARSTA